YKPPGSILESRCGSLSQVPGESPTTGRPAHHFSGKNPPSRGCRLQGNDSKTNSASRARLSSGAVALGSSLRRPAAWELASELASLVTGPERTETAGSFHHVVDAFH